MSMTLGTAQSSKVRFSGIVKQFPSQTGEETVFAVDQLTLDLEPGELVTLLGPSGCGKTTTLRMLAGFETPTSGDILINGQTITHLPPNKRNIGMVFQSYALFPHMTVYENVAYGLRIKQVSKSEMMDRVSKVLALMQLNTMKDRLPSLLSGGQQQRVALARAVVTEPKVLLFDEPLSNLDAKLREYMRDELRKIQQRLGITSLYVTHDQTEAMAISDKVVIMDKGRIQQSGSPRQIYMKPHNKFVANFMGKANCLQAMVERLEPHSLV
jgi:iron(III) transport system ATP-binding protein